jgi:hypothetical protein
VTDKMPHRSRIKKLEKALKPKPAFHVVIFDPDHPETARLPAGVVEMPGDFVVYISEDVAKIC